MYTAYPIDCAAEDVDVLIALLADTGFDSFEETETGVTAYGLREQLERDTATLRSLQDRFAFTYYSEHLEEKNWNAIWESGFQPIRIDDRLSLRATFHPPVPEVKYDLVIDPKMSFGTGHHATTYMMCELLLEHFPAHPAPGQRVLDYGCGTGVLGILAKRLGADQVDAVDIEPWAIENSRENAATNHVIFDRLVVGTLDEILTGMPYDLVLANINRNVLLASAEALSGNTRPGGRVYASGILLQDADSVIDRYRRAGFAHLRTVAREDWRALEFIRE
ncbi:ribosomal protein L11 methyltransferase [Neolewinella xylanilytica]|uniref:Ribosomal protein L11 methyltransferase n=1 Tax=Neolewinella xylanilytica TaxID=1514080 RepID=A0A2S6I5T0_9BACT|nr:50S ribosomal protein L11 methyltransferase [Neolewinella xylanilytica]PPK86524.1 ribosomal protein L11 methyltransferase [Neolewinella xylanilytica]